MFAISILGVIVLDSWLITCGFDKCPRPHDIQAYKPDEGGRIMDRNGIVMGRLETVRRVNVPLSFVPVFVRQAFIATEDRRFYKHNGVDFKGFLRALASNIHAHHTVQGFSTITMQVARNTFAYRRYTARSLPQKLLELRISRLLEQSLTKNQILELYFNAIYMGNGVYGVEAASRDLFGKSVSRVNMDEAAMLAALPKGPSVYTPRRNPKRAIARRNLVLTLMANEKYISPERVAGLQAQPLRIARDEWHPVDANDSYALDAVRAIADSVLKSGSSDIVDITVYTTLDARAQVAADRAVRRRASAIQSEAYRRGVIQGAMIAIDPRNGDLRAITGGRAYERGNFNRALAAHRQPGSAFKPFVYAAAMESGYTPASEVDDEPVDVIQPRADGRGRGSVWSPSNYNNEYNGRITFRRALIKSANAATVRVSQVVGLSRIIARAHANGIVSDIPALPSIALGAIEVTPIELVTAYAPFANGGFKVRPRLVRRIETSDGQVLWTSDNTPLERVMDPRDSYQVTSMLQSVVNYGTGRPIRDYGVKGLVAGKTGTTNNGADVWFVGYTPTVIAAFWFGFDNPAPIAPNASGGGLAAPAWAEWYSTSWREMAPPNAWSPPAGMSMKVIDAQTGFLANEYCPIRQQDYFKPGTEPTTSCPVHGPDYQDNGGDSLPQNWPDQRSWEKDIGKKISKALGKIFRF
ncbi:MAG: PBP1A family penicillin-binding protein [Gemmatimonadota bacterium]|nr:PBP1A family penicillin-binding protein [Gemmatimonadota bacterium]